MASYKTRWDNSEIYIGFDDSKMVGDLEKIQQNIERIKELSGGEELEIVNATETAGLRRVTQALLLDLKTYAQSSLSVGEHLSQANALLQKIDQLKVDLESALVPLQRRLALASEDEIKTYLAHADNQQEEARLKVLREMADTLLDVETEKWLKDLSVEGLTAWDRLYSQTASHLDCRMDGEKVSLGKVAACTASDDPELRKASCESISKAWRAHEATCVQILNAMIGWRIKEDRMRSRNRKTQMHYMEPTLHQGRLSEETLNVMMSVVENDGHVLVDRSMKLKAKVLGKDKLKTWDYRAGLKLSDEDQLSCELSYEKAMQLIEESCQSLGNKPAEFVRMMGERGYIDVADTANRRHGGYCTKFLKTGTPRIFMTYQDYAANAITLAHELGHAYHNWVMRDMSLDERWYPMTLAETASTFFETLFKDHLAQKSEVGAKVSAWQDISAVIPFLADIPHRYYMERQMYDTIARGESLTPELLRGFVTEQSRRFFGETLEDVDLTFWQSKLHFYIADTRFYNYPYTFGYLFSTYIYEHGKSQLQTFLPKYEKLLRDCGRLTCEEVAAKHMDCDITQESFWRDCLKVVEGQVARAEKVLN